MHPSNYKWVYHRPMRQSATTRLRAATKRIEHLDEPPVERGDEQFGLRAGCSFFCHQCIEKRFCSNWLFGLFKLILHYIISYILMTHKILICAVALMAMASATASAADGGNDKDFSFKFYGQVRADLFYNSRSNSETVDGLFYMYPRDHDYDDFGQDLNAKPDGSLYTMYSRLGVNITGPAIANGKIATSGCVEVDFRGGGTNYYMIRLRQAYLNLAWNKSQLLVGQTWHPFYGDVAPEILNLNMGAPYQPFSRAPQIRYRFTDRSFRLTAALLWQSQYLSIGPANNETGTSSTAKSQSFIKNSCVPEIMVGIDYKSGKWIAGVGADITSIVPRTQAEYNGTTAKVTERITSLSAEAHLKYKSGSWLVAGKTVLGNNFTQASGVGGYAITGIDETTGKQNYAPVKVSATWLNVAYGSKWRPAIFLGYLKNLGAGKPVLDVLGTGIGDGLDRLATATAELTYNIPHWKFGVEYMLCNAWYGSLDKADGKIRDTHTVMNHRVVMTAIFQF